MQAAHDMQRKVCVVTGANSGLGLAIATGLARQGATVVLACRNAARGAAAQAQIQAASGNPQVELMQLDLASLASVRTFADQYRARYSRLNVLVHNAGVLTSRRMLTPDGLETMFATNHLGPFLLTNTLLDVLKASALARVVTVTGPASTTLRLDDLQSEVLFHSVDAFAASRLCSQLCSLALARQLDGRGVTVNLVNPGLVRSNLMREAPAPVRWIWQIVAAPPERAAQPVLHLARSRELAGVTGRMFKRKRETELLRFVRDPNLQQKVWQASMALAGLA